MAAQQDDDRSARDGDSSDPFEEQTQPMAATPAEPASPERVAPEAVPPANDRYATVVARPPPSPQPPSRPEAPAAPARPMPSSSAAVDADPTEVAAPTVLEAPSTGSQTARVERRAPAPLALERIEPSLGRGERIALEPERSRIRIGRAESNELRLYTASASREHAVISADASGAWVVTPVPGRSLLVDGDEENESVPLEVGMNLVFGADHLRCVEPGAASSDAEVRSRAASRSEPASRRGPVLVGAAVVLALGAVASAWLWISA